MRLQTVRKLVRIVAAAASLAACSSTPPETTGFLGDYSGFERAPDRDTAWLLRSPTADLRDYDKVMFDAVVVQPLPGSKLGLLDRAVAQHWADALHAAMVETLSPYHTVVLSPGPHTLRVRIALTELAVGTATTGGAVALEAEMVDAQSGVRLAAVIERVGTPAAADPDEPLNIAFKVWANRLVDYLEVHGAE